MQRMKRLAAAIFLFGGFFATTSASAENYPSRPIRLLHGFAAGGAADTLSRIIADGLSKKLGQPIIVEAKPGAGGNIAADAIAKAAADGYTIGLVTGAHAISAATYKSLAYQPAESFEMISTLVYYALVIAVRSDYPAKSLGELVAMAKQKPGALSFGSVGFGSTHHLAGELLNAAAGVEIVHVPYRGDSQSVTALLGGEVPVIVGTPVLLAPQIQAGAIRGLAVTSPTRTALLPDVPTVQEAGIKGYDVRTWAGLLAPKGTPPGIIAALNAATLDALRDPDLKQRLETAVGGEVRGSSPEEMKTLIETEISKWIGVVERAKIPKI
ncbi:tripartite tricarboxylate transporter substrate binding protein [Bradyrhizobium canariense]|jgi:tripartite-type tricarboxylate transporter receptor subunit TctC|uniref:tripartite tricarboxylate transporter substrate binding protein n=1 Tax=Bradyrhizobium canariense TaxID=255045 RepID=UPI000A18D628|nr:tripartite tricarboxylate transporter substrate binding protein [Bradyrhizobium canariense]OSI20991.1 MFS transporter [Bradyrhizobium canariense]OSI31739.1 MFS transporter [Bradyrhizobium canariense]OSI41046.1 MFS transporter [Bradyrhizobium canariense]OSI44855.1 MFS transporter [Bradyrhizobium canariense]OSI52452.1 MFS transporter [Bradyrhizobium canariense]